MRGKIVGHVLADAPLRIRWTRKNGRSIMTALLEVKNLQVRVEEREILHGLTLTVNKGEVHAIMGPNGSGKSTLSHVIAGKPGYEVTGGEILFNGRGPAGDGARRARRQGRVPGVPVSGGDPRRRHHDFPAHRAERAAQGARRGRVLDAGFPEEGARGRRKSLEHPAGHAAPRRQCRLLRRREEAQRSAADGAVRAEPVHPRRDGFRPRHRRAARRRRRRQCAALARTARWW